MVYKFDNHFYFVHTYAHTCMSVVQENKDSCLLSQRKIVSMSWIYKTLAKSEKATKANADQTTQNRR